ncbi:MAG: hypothetical protein QM753_17720 [Thermomicrobiales bacterium]
MVATPRRIEIHDGQITLPEDMLEESGIGTSNGMVIVDLKESGEIVLRANEQARTPYPVSPALATLRQWVKDHPQGTAFTLSTQEQIDSWKDQFEQGVANEVWQSMMDYEDGK